MEIIHKGLDIVSMIVMAMGGLNLVFGMVSFGKGLGDRNGSEMQDSLYKIAGSAAIIAAGVIIKTIVLPS